MKQIYKIQNNLMIVYVLTIAIFVVFGRSFSGLSFFSFRLGELIVGFGMIFSFLVVLFHFYNKEFLKGFDKQLKTFAVLLFSFFVTLFINNGSLFNTYTYKSSSYIWTIGLLFFSYCILRNSSIKKVDKYIFSILLTITYLFSTIHYPEVFINFFTNNSDKWDFVKSSDIFLIYILTNTFNYLNFEKKINSFMYFMFSSAILIPLFLYMSKGSFFPSILYVLFFLLMYLKNINKERLKSFLIITISILLFVISTYEVFGNLNFEKGISIVETERDDSLLSVETLKRNISSISDQKNTSTVFASLYFSENRLFSTEQMLNWRLQIWQDILIDLNNKGALLTGYGYNEIIPVMDDYTRRGNDQSNENVHNYFFNVLARGGLFQLLIILSFIIFMLLEIKDKKMKIVFMLTIIPIYMTSFFDASMESVRFPLIFYFGIALIFKLDEDKYMQLN